MAELDWGRRFLMCAPQYYGVIYEINPWMHTDVVVDRDLAQEQWNNLITQVRAAGATVELIEPAEGWPDLVFTANAGVVNGNQFVPTHFKWPERQGEEPYNVEWFQENGFEVARLPDGVIHEGAGDALPFGEPGHRVLVSGFHWRSEAASHAYLSQLTGAAIQSVQLVDERLYHVDLTFTPLDERRAMVAPLAFDRDSLRSLLNLVPEPFLLEDDEALSFCCNAVVIGTKIVMSKCPPRVGRQLETWGFEVVECPVTEFMKGGGGCRCLTLALDASVSRTNA